MSKRRTNFSDSAMSTITTFDYYYDRLAELALSMFEWENLPDTVDPRFLELALFSNGKAVFFKDDELGFIALKAATSGRLNVYNVPLTRHAYASNGYHADLDQNNSVLIYNNYMRSNSLAGIRMFAKRLADLDTTIDVNAKAQKTPILIECDENERLTMANIYKEYSGDSPVIFARKGVNASKALSVLTTSAPYVCDKLYDLKTQIWNEALTYLGISNISVQKKERLITDEVVRNQGGTIASRYSRLETRREACKQINKMFGLNVQCNYRDDYQIVDNAPTISEAEESEVKERE